jgi:hypothetical protein
MFGPSAGELGDDLGVGLFGRHDAQSLGVAPSDQNLAGLVSPLGWHADSMTSHKMRVHTLFGLFRMQDHDHFS